MSEDKEESLISVTDDDSQTKSQSVSRSPSSSPRHDMLASSSPSTENEQDVENKNNNNNNCRRNLSKSSLLSSSSSSLRQSTQSLSETDNEIPIINRSIEEIVIDGDEDEETDDDVIEETNENVLILQNNSQINTSIRTNDDIIATPRFLSSTTTDDDDLRNKDDTDNSHATLIVLSEGEGEDMDDTSLVISRNTVERSLNNVKKYSPTQKQDLNNNNLLANIKQSWSTNQPFTTTISSSNHSLHLSSSSDRSTFSTKELINNDPKLRMTPKVLVDKLSNDVVERYKPFANVTNLNTSSNSNKNRQQQSKNRKRMNTSLKYALSSTSSSSQSSSSDSGESIDADGWNYSKKKKKKKKKHHHHHRRSDSGVRRSKRLRSNKSNDDQPSTSGMADSSSIYHPYDLINSINDYRPSRQRPIGSKPAYLNRSLNIDPSLLTEDDNEDDDDDDEENSQNNSVFYQKSNRYHLRNNDVQDEHHDEHSNDGKKIIMKFCRKADNKYNASISSSENDLHQYTQQQQQQQSLPPVPCKPKTYKHHNESATIGHQQQLDNNNNDVYSARSSRDSSSTSTTANHISISVNKIFNNQSNDNQRKSLPLNKIPLNPPTFDLREIKSIESSNQQLPLQPTITTTTTASTSLETSRNQITTTTTTTTSTSTTTASTTTATTAAAASTNKQTTLISNEKKRKRPISPINRSRIGSTSSTTTTKTSTPTITTTTTTNNEKQKNENEKTRPASFKIPRLNQPQQQPTTQRPPVVSSNSSIVRMPKPRLSDSTNNSSSATTTPTTTPIIISASSQSTQNAKITNPTITSIQSTTQIKRSSPQRNQNRKETTVQRKASTTTTATVSTSKQSKPSTTSVSNKKQSKTVSTTSDTNLKPNTRLSQKQQQLKQQQQQQQQQQLSLPQQQQQLVPYINRSNPLIDNPLLTYGCPDFYGEYKFNMDMYNFIVASRPHDPNDELSFLSLPSDDRLNLFKLMRANPQINKYKALGFNFGDCESLVGTKLSLKIPQFSNFEESLKWLADIFLSASMADQYYFYSLLVSRLNSPYRALNVAWEPSIDNYDVKVTFENDNTGANKDPSIESCVTHVLHVNNNTNFDWLSKVIHGTNGNGNDDDESGDVDFNDLDPYERINEYRKIIHDEDFWDEVVVRMVRKRADVEPTTFEIVMNKTKKNYLKRLSKTGEFPNLNASYGPEGRFANYKPIINNNRGSQAKVEVNKPIGMPSNSEFEKRFNYYKSVFQILIDHEDVYLDESSNNYVSQNRALRDRLSQEFINNCNNETF